MSIAAVETNTNGAVESAPSVVSVLTGVGGDHGSYVEMTPDDARHLSELLAEAARLAEGGWQGLDQPTGSG